MKVQDSCQTQQNAEKVPSLLFSALVVHTPMKREKQASRVESRVRKQNPGLPSTKHTYKGNNYRRRDACSHSDGSQAPSFCGPLFSY